MLEDKNDNLQAAAEGKEENPIETSSQSISSSKDDENIKVNSGESEVEEEQEEDPQNEIDESNAEDAEDEGHKDRHEIPMPDYHVMDMEALVNELEKLIRKEKVQAIKRHVDSIKSEFDLKFQELLEQKKEDFVNDGGNEIDFVYTTSDKKKFNELYGEYKEKKNHYYKSLENRLQANLENRLAIIEELKGLINVEENINDTYKHFKELQDRWRNAGPIPRVNYNDVWRTYHHHVEIFYDFLDLNRDLRDLDFKHNLEEKEKIIAQSEQLAEIGDVNKAFRELQLLHKIWKEDLGPVDREHRDAIWDRFSAATKVIHQKRQEYFKNQDAIHEANLAVKETIINKIKAITQQPANNHGGWQKQIKEVEALREDFFNAGRVPYKVNEQTWAAFKEAVRSFNRNKNSFYKNLKKGQQENLDKKMELVKLAQSLKDSEDWEETTPIMKKIQSDWKKIGHVPRKYSDKIWNEFKAACNHYFDKLHARKNEHFKVEMEAFEKKKAFLDDLKSYELSGDKEKDLAQVKQFIADWKTIGKIPHSKKSIEGKFNKILDALFKKLDVEKQKAELIKYGNKLDQLANSDNDSLINNERIFIRRKIDEVKSEIRQLENNLQFINADDSNPIVQEVQKNIEKHREDLNLWKAKLKKLKNMDQ
ncbi:DUF349 domain-containing protein [Galbibacter mesophilus]|uniref:DUF349 domain-containing protein n=1 Tax=Galbibacter mesophilus TaxID=379069 RepID=UPI00191D6EDD|nr:DUF349 domain-containing protein [Galbibacter mesophilus]MCM5663151.1 DUF349 domain-containing protein [Galbibacter mesophilus]